MTNTAPEVSAEHVLLDDVVVPGVEKRPPGRSTTFHAFRFPEDDEVSRAEKAFSASKSHSRFGGDFSASVSERKPVCGTRSQWTEGTAESERKESKFVPETTIHTWVIFAATEHGTRMSLCRMLAILSVSPLFILMQFIVMMMIIDESSAPRCMLNEECQVGNWCKPYDLKAPPPSGKYPGSAGWCADCSYLFDPRFALPLTDHASHRQDMIEWYNAGHAYCDRKDTIPERCDHLVHSLERLSDTVFLVLIFCIGVIMYTIVEDVNQAYVETTIVFRRTARLFKSMSPKRKLVERLCSINMGIRIFVIPVYLVQTAIALIFSGSMTSQSIMLNALTVAIISNVDHICWYFFIPPQSASSISHAFADEYQSLVLEGSRTIGFAESRTNSERNDVERRYGASFTADLENQGNAISAIGGLNPAKGVSRRGFTHSSRRVQIAQFSTWILIRLWAFLIGLQSIIQLLDTEAWMDEKKTCQGLAWVGVTGAEQISYPALLFFEAYRRVDCVRKCKKKRRSVRAILRQCMGLLIDLFFYFLANACLVKMQYMVHLVGTSIVRGFGHAPPRVPSIWKDLDGGLAWHF